MLRKAAVVDEPKKSFSRWLVLELAPTIYGHKPATILSFRDWEHMRLHSLWQRCGKNIIAKSRLKYMVLKESPASTVVLFYHPGILQKCITDNAHRDFLTRYGYQVDGGVDQCLIWLRERFQHTCPHEIGVLLGIPLKDVLGYMGLNQTKLTCRGLWCIYGEPSCSIALMERFMADRRRIIELLGEGHNPLRLLCG